MYVFTSQNDGWTTDPDIPDHLTELKDANGVRTGWRYTVAADDSVETYAASGKLLTIADRTGRLQTLTYDLPLASGGDDDADTLDTVTDDTGRQLRFGYDAYKRISTVTDPAGGVISYGYDAQSNLVSVTYPDGRGKTYHYNEPEHTAGANLPHALTGITDENGDRYATYQYQADGKAISTGHAGGADLYTLNYGPSSTTVTDPLGTQRTHNFTTILATTGSGLALTHLLDIKRVRCCNARPDPECAGHGQYCIGQEGGDQYSPEVKFKPFTHDTDSWTDALPLEPFTNGPAFDRQIKRSFGTK